MACATVADQGRGKDAEDWLCREPQTSLEGGEESEEEEGEVAMVMLVMVSSKGWTLAVSRSLGMSRTTQRMCRPWWPRALCRRKSGCWTATSSLQCRLW